LINKDFFQNELAEKGEKQLSSIKRERYLSNSSNASKFKNGKTISKNSGK